MLSENLILIEVLKVSNKKVFLASMKNAQKKYASPALENLRLTLISLRLTMRKMFCTFK